MADDIPFAEWKPDLSDRANPASEARGVISKGGQYAPFKDLSDYNGSSAATAAECLGAGAFYEADLTPHIFLGDTSKLYHMESRVAVDRSKMGGYSIASQDTWAMAQFGDYVVAVANNAAPQVADMGAGTVTFADLGGSPPSSSTAVARVNDFLWLGKDFTVHWSAFNDITDWTPDPSTQAGNQELDQELGRIQKIIGLDYAVIFQQRGIRRAIYVGPPVVWDFGQDAVEKARGCISRNGAKAWGKFVFYVADDGFYSFNGQASEPIGNAKVDDYFVRNLNYAYRHKVATAIDSINKLFVVGFPAGTSQIISELLIYSITDGRWTHDLMDLDIVFDTPVEVLTVDNFHTIFTGDNLDGSELDPYHIDTSVFDDERRLLAAVRNSNHRLGTFSGNARQAIVETGEFEARSGGRALVTEIWPKGNFQQAEVAASVGYRRALPGATLMYTNPTAMNRVGYCPQRIDARFMRGRVQVAANSLWTRLEGIGHTTQGTGDR